MPMLTDRLTIFAARARFGRPPLSVSPESAWYVSNRVRNVVKSMEALRWLTFINRHNRCQGPGERESYFLNSMTLLKL